MCGFASRRRPRKMSKPSRFSRPARRTVLVLSLALLLAPIGSAAIAQNRTLDAPRSAGTVGERYDGYAVVRDPAQAASLAPVVDQVNGERPKIHGQRSPAYGVPIDQISRNYTTG